MMASFDVSSSGSGCDAAPRPEPLLVSTVASPEHELMVRSYIRVLAGSASQVDDLTQEVFLRAISRLHLFQGHGDPARLLRGFCRRVVQEHFRSTRRTRSHPDLAALALAAEACPARAAQHAEASRLLHEAISELPILSRRLVELRYKDGLAPAAIAQTLGMTPVAVRVTLLRIRDRLRARLSTTGRLAA